MIVEGVNFIESACLAMSKEQFIERHMVFFKDRTEDERRKLLAKIYTKMKKK